MTKGCGTENELYKKLLAEVIPASEIGVTYEDVGALEKKKGDVEGIRDVTFSI